VCCALPALFVAVGAGASFASLVGTFPQLVWLSEQKVYLFTFGGLMLGIAGVLQWQSRKASCPVGDLQQACKDTKDWSIWVYFVSLALFLIAAMFAFILPRFF